MKPIKAFYDGQEDILYLGNPGEEEEYVEIHPDIHLELDAEKKIIGIEILDASKTLRQVIPSLAKKIRAA